MQIIKKGCVAEAKEVPFVVNPWTVAYNRAVKPKLVLDCRHLNQFLAQYKFKFGGGGGGGGVPPYMKFT